MKKIAVFPGSFDPFTLGHEAIVKRALPLFDKIIIGIGVNSSKKGFIPINERKTMISDCFKELEKVEIKEFSGLTVDFCKAEKANFILRGLRDGKDFDYERSIAIMNREMNKEIETYFMITNPEYTAINATIVREIANNGGDITPFVPQPVANQINIYLKKHEN